MHGVSAGTMTGLITLGVFLAIIWGWRRWGLLGAIGIAIAACLIAGSYANPVRDFIVAGARAGAAPFNAVAKLVK